MSAYRGSIDETTWTIERRAKYYRNLVIGVVLLGLASVGAAVGLRALSPLSCLLLLIPLCGLFYYLDARLLASWRSGLLESWASGEIDFSALLEALRATPTLPKETLAAMLSSLPVSGTLATEHEVPLKSREAAVAVVMAIHAYRADVLALKTGAAAIVVVSLICAVLLNAWYPLPFTGVALLFSFSAKAIPRFRLQGATAKIPTAQLDPTFSFTEFERFALALDWKPISDAQKERLIAAIRSKDCGDRRTEPRDQHTN